MLVYRNEIDGLRSIAVVPVILYHAGLTRLFGGGYVGVDIFFVISGYLITSVVENECEKKTFSLVNFYERRCRRILPLLFFILFLSTAFAYYWMLPEQLKEFGEALISVVGLSSNIFFWWKDDNYFTQLTELNPLVHTWSLAVEEQFYFIFPLLYYLFDKNKHYLTILLICLALMSLFLGQWGGNLQSTPVHHFQMFSQHSYATFYLPLGRIWELLLGALAALYLRADDSLRKPFGKFSQFFAFVGLMLITFSVLFFDIRNIPPFPNFYTLIPTCGAALIIVFGDKTTLVGYLLSTRPLSWVGLISYSAYLWHQPLFAFFRLRSNKTSQMLYIIIVISGVLPLSVFTYFLIEQPFRNKNRFSRKHIFGGAGIATIITFILALFIIRTANNRSLSINKGGDPYLSDLKEYGNAPYVARQYDDLVRTKNTFSNETSLVNRRLVLIGDSFSQDFYNMIIEGKYLVNYDICVYYIPAHCQIYMGVEDQQQLIEVRYRHMCVNGNNIKYALPLIRQANVIILTSLWKEWSVKRLPMTLILLNLTKEQQIFVIGAKHFGKVKPMLYINKSTEYRLRQYQYPNMHVVKINNLLEKLIDQSIFVNIQKMICTGYSQTCPLFNRDGKLISFDGYHLTKYGAVHIGNIIFTNKPLNKL